MDLSGFSDWAAFCESLDLGALVPEEFAQYRPIIIDCAGFVLRNMSPVRTIAILADQLSLGDEATIGDRIVGIARHCPALHKLAQLVARDRRLPLDFRRSLQILETMQTAIPLEDLRRRIEEELGPLEALGVSLDGEPLAEASVAVVTPFVWRHDGEEKRGVFKVLKEGVRERLEEDLDLLVKIAARLDQSCEAYGIPPIDYETTFQLVRDLLQFEIRLDREQEHLVRAATTFAGLPTVRVPALYPFCTPGITAMERIDGCRVTDAELKDADARGGLAMLVTEALLARPLWSSAEVALFHADPHAGNLVLTPDNRLGLLDWSLVGSLNKPTRIALTQIMISALSLDAPRIAGSIDELSVQVADPAALAAVIDARLAEVRHGGWPGVNWLQGLLEDAQARAGARFGVELVLFYKVLHVLRGVLADIDEEARLDSVLARLLMTRLGIEWTGRLFMPPFSRAPSSNLSTMDLCHLLFSAPAVATRYWWRYYEQALFRAVNGPADAD